MPIVRFVTNFLKKQRGRLLSCSGLHDLFRLCFPVLRYFAGKNLNESLIRYLHADQSCVHSDFPDGKSRMHRAFCLESSIVWQWMPRLGRTFKARSLPVRKTWFHGLALTLGVTAIPGIASAQYSIGDSGGLAASSFNAKPSPPPSTLRNYIAPPQGQTGLAAYAQNGPVGSGIPGGYEKVPALVIENSVLNSQYQSTPPYALPGPQPYEQIQGSPNSNAVQPMYPVPSPMPGQTDTSSCPACNAGNCATHGVGVGNIGNGYGSSESCYSEPAVSCAPSVLSINPWIFGASGLIFNRLDNEYVQLTTNTQDGANASPMPNPYAQSFLSTSNANMNATGGVQLSAGRYFCCGRYAIIGTYWGVFSNPQSATILASDQTNGNLRSNLPLTLRGPSGAWQYGIRMPGQTVYDWYDGAFAHRILRDQEFHSAELNFFSFALGGGARQAYSAAGSCVETCQSDCNPVACSGPTGPCAPWYGAQCSKLRLNMYGGVRWFRFRDSLEYASSENDADFNGGADDFYYRNGVTNDLVGFQLGSLATWCTGTRLNLFGGGNFGVYGNHIGATTFAGTATQTATILSPNSAFDGRLYDYSSSLNDVALMGEGTLGAGLRIGRGWTANASYRLVGVSGVATAVGQIPRDFARGDSITHINNNHSLLLHGVSLGANYNF